MRTEGDSVVLMTEERVDSGNAARLAEALAEAERSYPGRELILDCEQLRYISSAGLRVLLETSGKPGLKLVLRNVSPVVYETFDITGFTDILRVERRLREIDVTGCEVIGWGAVGTVYRLDPDTIVKVYDVPNALEMIRNEQNRAKQALRMGVPTAISYDAVRVGSRYGSVFEMVNAKTVNDMFVEHPEDADRIIRDYAGVIRRVHAIEAKPGLLPDCRTIWLGYLDAVADVMPREAVEALRARLLAMPEDLHLVHGDFHMKNVMLSGNSPLLIDMDTLSVGSPVFDFAGLYVAYQAFCDDEPENSMKFLNIPTETCARLWRTVLALCLEGADEARLRHAENRAMLAGCVRFLYLLTVLKLGREDLRAIRLEHTTARILQLLEEEDGLEI